MDLKRRLAELDRLSQKARTRPAPAPATETRPVTLDDLGLITAQGTGGTCWFREDRRPLAGPSFVAADLVDFFTCVPPVTTRAADLLFMDTETTGLAGGTGTVAFLVGLGWWDGGDFVTRQYFLPAPGREIGLLTAVAEIARSFTTVVTYNGAAFDLPLLRTRALLNRLPDPFADLTVWDLLVPARRLWRRRLADCRQQTVEAAAGFTSRQGDDIPGAMIPQIWFDFLAGEGDRGLAAVLAHNRWDLEGMAAILGNVVAAAAYLERTAAPAPAWPWQDLWSLARIALAAKRTERAASLLTAALDDTRLAGSRSGRYAEPGFVGDAIVAFKRRRDWPQVSRIIGLALGSGLDRPWLHREAAILYEHRLVDLPRALAHALRADDDHRVRRLRRRLAT